MYARITRLQAPPDRIDDLHRAFTTSALPALRKISGYAGTSMGVDRTSGDGQAATFWDSQQTLEGSREAATRIRTETTEAGGAKVVAVQEFEIALMERFTQPSAPSFLRVMRGTADPAKLDTLVQQVRDEAVPVLRDLPGVRAVVAAIDRATGQVAVTGVYESAEARQAADSRVADIRRRIFEAAGAGQPEISFYEVLTVEFVGVGAASG